jgi:thiamine-phosphate pyrophosphorylase
MAVDLSPAVERAADAARQRAGGPPRLADWLLALTDDEDGKPVALLERAGVDVAAVRAAADGDPITAPPPPALYATARERSIALRGDPAVTTEFVLLAVLSADGAFQNRLAAAGLRLADLERLLDTLGATAVEEQPPGPEFVVADPTDQADAARVVDAGLNRARESLRVLDDYCRFVLNDAVLTEEVKRARHDLAEATKGVAVLAARDTPGDVGVSLTAGGEYVRRTPAEVAAVNLKRLQESLRSVEEFGKLFGPELGRRAEAIRYRAYTLERAVLAGGTARGRLAGVRLYALLTGSRCVASLDWTIAEAAAGGVQMVQLREKELPDRTLLERARQVRNWTRAAGVLFVVNDRPDIARLAEADGVHLGQDDLPVAAARRIAGPDVLIGVSTHSTEQVRRAVLDGADYLGVGPTFPSTTKAFDRFAGLEFVRQAAALTSLPWFALGGIQADNLQQVIDAGATRAAVSSAVCSADEPRQAAATLRRLLGG